MNKYHSRKTVVDGTTFDSVKESKRYMELKLLEKAGKITELRTHPSFVLQPSFKCYGQNFGEINYIADFIYHDIELCNTVVEDVKGMHTDVYRLKKNLSLKMYGNELIFKEV